MDDAEFKRRLSEVADWEIPKNPRDTSLNQKKKRVKKQDEDDIIEEPVFADDNNPTIPPLLKKVRVAMTTCEDCGEQCPKGRRTTIKLYERGDKKYWREDCNTCSRAKNPYTGEFDVKGVAANQLWYSYMKPTKGLYQSKGNLAKNNLIKSVIKHDNNLEIQHENDQEIIRINTDNLVRDK
jgi:hypothetical protein